MKLKEKEIQNLEKKIPYLAKDSAKQAFKKILSSGSGVLITENGELLKVFPDGKQVSIAKIAPRIAIKKGTIFNIK